MPLIKLQSGINLSYQSFGKGFPFVLIAGTGSSSSKWKIYQTGFFSKYYKTIVYDHRGTGKSDKPDVVYTTRMLAADLNELLNALNIEQAHILGHSMGGQVAQWFALDYPARTKALVLADTGCGRIERGKEYTRGISLMNCLRLIEARGSIARYNRNMMLNTDFWFSPEFRKKNPEMLAKIVRIATYNSTPIKFYLRHIIARQMHETTDLLGKIKVLTLILVGENDHFAEGTGDFVRQCQFMASRIPNSKFVMIKGARHGIFWEKPDETNKATLRWLREHD